MDFDVNAALKEGVSEDQIIDYLSGVHEFDAQGALNEGVQKRQIIDYLSQLDFTPPEQEKKGFIQEFQEEKAQQPLEAFGSSLVGAGKRVGEVAFETGKFGAETLGRIPRTIAGEGFTPASTFEKPKQLERKGVQEKAGSAAIQALEFLIPGPKAGGSALQTLGKLGKTIGEKAFKLVTPLSKKEAGLIQKYRADTPVINRIGEFFSGVSKEPQITAKTAVEKGLAGTQSMIGVGAKRTANDLWKKKIAPAVSSIKETINRDDLFTEVLDDLGKIADPTTQASRLKAFSAILDDYKNLPEMSYTKAQQIKSELQRILPNKVWRGEDITGEYNNIRKLLSEKISQKTYSKLKNANIKKDYLDYGNLINLQELGKSAMTGSKLKGGFGSFWSEIAQRAVTPIATVGGQVLYRTGNLTFIAGKGVETVGDYIIKFLTK